MCYICIGMNKQDKICDYVAFIIVRLKAIKIVICKSSECSS